MSKSFISHRSFFIQIRNEPQGTTHSYRPKHSNPVAFVLDQLARSLASCRVVAAARPAKKRWGGIKSRVKPAIAETRMPTFESPGAWPNVCLLAPKSCSQRLILYPRAPKECFPVKMRRKKYVQGEGEKIGKSTEQSRQAGGVSWKPTPRCRQRSSKPPPHPTVVNPGQCVTKYEKKKVYRQEIGQVARCRRIPKWVRSPIGGWC